MSTLPEEMWFGNIDGQWQVQCWESEVHALSWLQQGMTGQRRRLWKAKVVNPVEFRAVEPKPYLTQLDAKPKVQP